MNLGVQLRRFSSKILEGAYFLLVTCDRKQIHLGKNCQAKMNYLRNSQTIWIVNMSKLGGLLSEKCALEKKPRVWLDDCWLMHGRHQKIRLFSRTVAASLKRLDVLVLIPSAVSEGKIETRFSRKDLWKSLMSNGTDFLDMHKRPTRFLSVFC